jgi:HipA-like protein
MSSLAILMNGVEAGRLDYERGRLTLTYLSSWRERRDAVPISLSMPLMARGGPRRRLLPHKK